MSFFVSGLQVILVTRMFVSVRQVQKKISKQAAKYFL